MARLFYKATIKGKTTQSMKSSNVFDLTGVLSLIIDKLLYSKKRLVELVVGHSSGVIVTHKLREVSGGTFGRPLTGSIGRQVLCLCAIIWLTSGSR